jgi:hypothetical protein
VAGQHEELAFEDGVVAEREVDGHLVPVEVGVERRRDEGVEPDRLALDEDRLERLDAEAVERRGAVEEDGCPSITFSRMSNTSAVRRSTTFFALLTVLTIPRSMSFRMMNGLNSSTAISFGRPHSCIRSSGPTTITDRPE